MTTEYYSNWETGKNLPAKARRVFAALTFLNHLLQKEDTRRSVDVDDLADTIELITRRTFEAEDYAPSQATIAVDESEAPPAWQIAELTPFSPGDGDAAVH